MAPRSGRSRALGAVKGEAAQCFMGSRMLARIGSDHPRCEMRFERSEGVEGLRRGPVAPLKFHTTLPFCLGQIPIRRTRAWLHVPIASIRQAILKTEDCSRWPQTAIPMFRS
jgi:hypothetical protein